MSDPIERAILSEFRAHIDTIRRMIMLGRCKRPLMMRNYVAHAEIILVAPQPDNIKARAVMKLIEQQSHDLGLLQLPLVETLDSLEFDPGAKIS